MALNDSCERRVWYKFGVLREGNVAPIEWFEIEVEENVAVSTDIAVQHGAGEAEWLRGAAWQVCRCAAKQDCRFTASSISRQGLAKTLRTK